MKWVLGQPSFFGHARWCEGVPLRDIFRSLYSHAACEDATVAAYCEHVSGTCVWHHVFIWDPFRDDAMLVSFVNWLNGITAGNFLLIKLDEILILQ